jgi:colicin import membrane protein
MLVGMVLVSGLAHLVAGVLILLIQPHFTLRPRAVTAYVVDLVASDQLAGTNLVAGNQGKVEAPPKAVEPPKPPPKPEVVKPPEPAPKPEAKKEEPKPEVKKEEPKVDEQAVALAKPTQAKAIEPTPTPIVQAKADVAKPQPAVAPPAAEPPKPAGTPTLTNEQAAARARDEQIAKAIVERAKLAAKASQAGTAGGGSGKAGGTPGGPVSVGPGTGPGTGIVMGVEFLIYRNQLETRLKEAWAWADTKTELSADVRFRIAEDGGVSDVRITRSSGNAAYDESVLRAVRAVNPLPPPPQTYRKQFADVEYTFSPTTMNQ